MKAEYIARKVKNFIPWRFRYWLKLAEAKNPGLIPNVFKQKSDSEYYNDCFYTAIDKLGIKNMQGKIYCEMGSGQFLLHAFLAYQMGADSSYLLEIDDFAHQDDTVQINKHLFLPEEKRIRKLPKPKVNQSWREYLGAINAHYYTDGLNGYERVPDDSVDYTFSYSVVEHIRKNQFKKTMCEMYRFMRSGGVCYHTVDLMDHMGHHKNHLRFSEDVWENEIHYRMDNYTNRLMFSEITALWREIGFDVEVLSKNKVEAMDRKLICAELRGISEDDLTTGSFVAVLRK